MAIVQINLKVSPNARAILTDIQEEMTRESGRAVTYSEVIERLAALYRTEATRP